MSKIYEILKERVFDNNTRNKVFYNDYMNNIGKKYTYYDLFKYVKFYIEYIKKKYTNKICHICFQVINNSFEDYAMFIALMECGYKPIIVNKDKLFEMCDKDIPNGHIDENVLDFFVVMPFGNSPENLYYEKDNIGELESLTEKNMVPFLETNSDYNDHYIDSGIISDTLAYEVYTDENHGLFHDEYDFGLLTSGTTGEFKIKKIKESEFIDFIFRTYDTESLENYINFTPISSISGLTFNLYLPVFDLNKTITISLNSLFPIKFIDGNISILLPGNAVLFNENYDYSNEIDAKKIKHIYFLGNRLSYKSIENIKKNIPIGDDCIYNYYGNTENMGLVSKCNQSNLVPVYINFVDLSLRRMYYTYDKKHIYMRYAISNEKLYTTLVDDEYDEDKFIEVMPICANYDENPNIAIDLPNWGIIKINDCDTDDRGFVLDNRVYFLGRKNEFIRVNGKTYYLPGIEKLINKDTENKCICSINNELMVYLPINYDKNSLFNYRKSLSDQLKIKKVIDKYNLPIDYIVVLDKKDVPYGVEIGKLRRDELSNFFIAPVDETQFEDYNKFVTTCLKVRVEVYLDKIIDFDYKDGLLTIPKKNIEIYDLFRIIYKHPIFDFREDEDNYYLMISDKFLMGSFDEVDDVEPVSQYDLDRYMDAYKESTLRGLIFLDQDLLEEYKLTGVTFIDEYGRFSLAVKLLMNKTRVYVNRKISNYQIEGEYRSIALIPRLLNDSLDSIIETKYSIDDDHIYVDDKLIEDVHFNDFNIKMCYDLIRCYSEHDSKNKR